MISLKLLKQIENDEAQLLFSLHKGNSMRRSRQKIGQIGAFCRCDKITPIFFLRDSGIDPVDDVVAQ
jgi:hypothetical protein